MTDFSSDSANNTAAPHSSPDGLSEGARLLGVFFQPSRTFAEINRNARWWTPFLLMAIANLALAFTIDKTIGFQGVAEQSIQANPKAAERMEGLSPEQRASQLAMVTKITKYAIFVSPLLLFVIALVAAVVLMGTFNFGFGRELRFGSSLAVFMYALFPGIVYTALAILVLGLSDHPENINIQNMVATNPAFLFDQTSISPALYALLRNFDIFYLWPVVLLGIGFSAIGAGKRSTTMAVVFSFWLLLVLVRVGFASLG